MRMKIKISALLIFAAIFISISAHAASPFEVMWNDKPVSAAKGGIIKLNVTIGAPPGYYLYADETKLEFPPSEDYISVSQISYPDSEPYDDPYIGKRAYIYRGDVSINAHVKLSQDVPLGLHDLTAKLTMRGCSPELCLRPEEREIKFLIEVGGGAGSEVDVAERGSISSLFSARKFDSILNRGLFIAILVVFLAGLITSFTPCILPMVPVLLTFIGVKAEGGWLKNLGLSAVFVAGMVIVYAALGLIAVALGKNLGFLFQMRWFLWIVCIFFIAMSLSMFGLFDLALPRFLAERIAKIGGSGWRGAILAGMGSGLMASPCAGPVIATLLAYVALEHRYLEGFLLLSVYGIGMGLVIVILGAGYGTLVGKLRGGRWLIWVKRLLGLLLIAPAIYYGAGLIGSLSKVDERGDQPRIEWLRDEAQALKFAAESGRGVMIEFRADWCPPCVMLEKNLFSREDIVKLSYQLVPLKIDATVETEEVRRAIAKYGVIGWPTVVFLSASGTPYVDLRVNSYDPSAIERGMKEVVSH